MVHMIANLDSSQVEIITQQVEEVIGYQDVNLLNIDDVAFIEKARRLSIRLFEKLKDPNNDRLKEQDLVPCFSDRQLGSKAYRMLTGWWQGIHTLYTYPSTKCLFIGGVSLPCFYSSIVKIISDRKLLQNSLHGGERSLVKFEHSVTVVLCGLLIGVYAMLLGMEPMEVSRII
jgi:hypothetical protein